MLLQDPRLDFYITKGRRVQAPGRSECEPIFDQGGKLNGSLQHHLTWVTWESRCRRSGRRTGCCVGGNENACAQCVSCALSILLCF